MSKRFDPLPNEAFSIGENCLIEPMTTLAFVGFGFAKDRKRRYKIPLSRKAHNFRVIIEDDVDIGASCCIDRGSWRDTVIGKGSKIDNLCHIAHNVVIGKHTWIAALSCICGSVTIGDQCEIGAHVTILPGLKIGNKVIIGGGSVVTKDVPDNTTVAGNPARPLEKNKFVAVP